MRALAATALLAVVALTGCSEDLAQNAVDQAKSAVSSAAADANVQLPSVDWSQYSDKLKSRIDNLASKADCGSLQQTLTDQANLDPTVEAYVKAKLKEAGCS